MATREWISKQNCSISPKQLAKVYAALCLSSFSVAAYFTMHGAWLVMVFAVLEMIAVATAFLYFGRHATDSERIALIDDRLLVEFVKAEKTRQINMDPRRTRVALPAVRHGLIGLEANGARIEVGRFLTERRRREFAQELTRELGGYGPNFG